MSYVNYSRESKEAQEFMRKAQHRKGNIYYYNNYVCIDYGDVVRIQEKMIGHDSMNYSFNGTITDEKISIVTGIGDIIATKIGDISDAYTLLQDKLKGKNIDNFDDVMEAIIITIDEYFGGYSNLSRRLQYYNPGLAEDNKISNLKGKGAAMCSERAALAQNLLASIGINVTYNTSYIDINGKKEFHAYNLIEHNGKYYLFDSCYPLEKNGHINPLIGEISQEAFELITHPDNNIGYSIITEHFCPYNNSNVRVEYDPGRDKKEEINLSNNIKKSK